MPPEDRASPSPDGFQGSCSLRHLRIGWWSLLIFLSLGIALETFHVLKIKAYIDISNETRRLMWSLAHAHGTLLSLVHLGFSSMVLRLRSPNLRLVRLSSYSFIGAGILLPAGFFLGGINVHSGDPGLGVLLVPVGALLLIIAVLMAARSADRLGKLYPVTPSNTSGDSAERGKQDRRK